MTDERTDENNSAMKLQPACREKTHNFRKNFAVIGRPRESLGRREARRLDRRQSLKRQHLAAEWIGDRDLQLRDSEWNLITQPQVDSIAQRMIGVLGLKQNLRGGMLTAKGFVWS